MLGFAIIIGGLGLIMMLERLYPDQKLKDVSGWWMRVLLINGLQLIITVIGMFTWEQFFQGYTIFHLKDHVNPFMGGLIAYLINTWLFYWWHRARHEIDFLWLMCHQLHHSAQRIEAITSFYKHPFEILVDSIMMTILSYPILGLSTESSIYLSAFSAFSEFFYHMNIRTPQWIGFIFQRPESHRVHHSRYSRVWSKNYSDLPIWDILGDTFDNPKEMTSPTGYPPAEESRIWDMIRFRDVHLEKSEKSSLSTTKNRIKSRKWDIGYKILLITLIIVGCIQSYGYLFNFPIIRGIGLVMVSSPLPLVFSSYNGVETFSTEFTFNITTYNGKLISVPMTSEIYSQIDGPYNRRNVYGAIFSHGPFFKVPKLLTLRQQILHYAICQGNLHLRLPQYNLTTNDIKQLDVIVKSKTKGNEDKIWNMSIVC